MRQRGATTAGARAGRRAHLPWACWRAAAATKSHDGTWESNCDRPGGQPRARQQLRQVLTPGAQGASKGEESPGASPRRPQPSSIAVRPIGRRAVASQGPTGAAPGLTAPVGSAAPRERY